MNMEEVIFTLSKVHMERHDENPNTYFDYQRSFFNVPSLTNSSHPPQSFDIIAHEHVLNIKTSIVVLNKIDNTMQ